MKNLVKSAMLAGLLLGVSAQPALAQASQNTGVIVPGIAVANIDAVIANSNAFRTAQQQRPTTYKAQIDAAEARRVQLQNQIKPMAEKLEADSKSAKPNQALLQQQYEAIQLLQQNGQQELQRMMQPVALSEAYVTEQVEDKLDQAVKSAMNKKKISLVLNPSSVVAVNNNAYNLNQDILAELNTLLPSAQLVPPQGWEPRQMREARAAQAAQQQPAAGTAQPATPGR